MKSPGLTYRTLWKMVGGKKNMDFNLQSSLCASQRYNRQQASRRSTNLIH
jgi:hypothetical protein